MCWGGDPRAGSMEYRGLGLSFSFHVLGIIKGEEDNMKSGVSCYFTLCGILLHSIPFIRTQKFQKWCQTVMKTDAHSGNKAHPARKTVG